MWNRMQGEFSGDIPYSGHDVFFSESSQIPAYGNFEKPPTVNLPGPSLHRWLCFLLISSLGLPFDESNVLHSVLIPA